MQIIGILKEQQAGLPVTEICRRHGISDATFYTWHSRYGGMEVRHGDRPHHPRLLALFSIVTLLAARLPARQRRQIAAAAWYPKPRPTFADALAAVRCAIWRERTLATSPRRRARTKPSFQLPAPWAYALCHAA